MTTQSLVGRYEHLNVPRGRRGFGAGLTSRPLLEKIASQVKPIMTKRKWTVGTLGEVRIYGRLQVGVNGDGVADDSSSLRLLHY
jgi:hypothetical protein